MSLRIKIESQADLNFKINSAIARIFDNILANIVADVESEGQLITPYLWMQTATYNSLINGELSGQIGFPKGTAQSYVDPILYKAAKSIKVQYAGTVVYNNTFKSRMYIYILQHDLLDVRDSIDSLVANESGHVIDWLDWLLTKGDRIIVGGFRYQPKAGAGRSFKGFMAGGGNFRIPSEHSGVLGDNWLTRALESYINTIALSYRQIIERLIKARL